jgi:S-adenosylmethionine hydrolase
LSDFGVRDHYAGTMKAVALGICPEATLVDITHDVPAHDVLTAALELAASYRYFPTGTVFLTVVDPGVGSARRGIAAETADFRFVAPDNGVLTAVLRETPPRRVVELTERRY